MVSRNCVCWVVAAVIATGVAVLPAWAKPIAKTRYIYFPVSGTSAAALHRSILAHGPTVNGDKAYASLEFASDEEQFLVQDADGCQLHDYQLKLNFTMRLPRLTAGSSLDPDLRKRWQTFERFAHKHEATHRDIWMKCAAAAEAKVRSIKTGRCEAAQALATGIFNQMWAKCAKHHDAFDAAQRYPLMRQPFITAANPAVQEVTKDGSRIRAAKAGRPRPRHPRD
jgi:predicted secreted Zn-dependent protease